MSFVFHSLFLIQGLGELDTAVGYYKEVLKVDATSVEAIACIGTHHFYSDQPEIALRFYRCVCVCVYVCGGGGGCGWMYISNLIISILTLFAPQLLIY